MGKMSAKRRPGTELNHDNWDDDEAAEEVGEFPKATEDEMKQRTIRVAKRRARPNDEADGITPTAAVFKGFTGFGQAAAAATTASSPFSFLSSGSAGASSSAASPFASISFGAPAADNKTADEKNKNNGSTESPKLAAAPAINFGVPSVSSPTKTPEKSSAYYAKLKGLNQSVAAWISKRVGENPVCLLTPIFDDYAKYLKEIDQNTSTAASTTVKTPDFSFSAAASSSSGSSSKLAKSSDTNIFGSIAAETKKTDAKIGDASPAKASPFQSSSSSASTFSFGALPSSTGSTGFSFGGPSKTPFSFSNVKKPDVTAEPSTSGTTADDDNEEPPKNEFTPVVEEDSLFTKRCKVFVKTGDEYVDRGVGQLFIKSADEGKKTQLLVRADTNLGNILLNILLTEAVPASRMGKNNVMMICIPTPDSKPPPATVLVRVKNAEEADELLAQITKHKK